MSSVVTQWVPVAVGLLVGLLVLGSATADARTAAPAAPAIATVRSAGDEAAFVGRINSMRASMGLSQLQVSGDLTAVARGWTSQMAAAGAISHNGALGSQVPGNWQKLGENVGVGYDVPGLMQAFVDSPNHYRNLVDPAWTHVGVGVVAAADGRMWTTHTFMAMGAPPPPPGPPPTAAPVTAAPAPATSSAPPAPGPAPEPAPEPVAEAPPATDPARPDDTPARTAAVPGPDEAADDETSGRTGDAGAAEPTPERVAAVLGPLRAIEP
jgi:hypothetical protein